jgi:hypothetical protein
MLVLVVVLVVVPRDSTAAALADEGRRSLGARSHEREALGIASAARELGGRDAIEVDGLAGNRIVVLFVVGFVACDRLRARLAAGACVVSALVALRADRPLGRSGSRALRYRLISCRRPLLRRRNGGSRLRARDPAPAPALLHRLLGGDLLLRLRRHAPPR